MQELHCHCFDVKNCYSKQVFQGSLGAVQTTMMSDTIQVSPDRFKAGHCSQSGFFTVLNCD